MRIASIDALQQQLSGPVTPRPAGGDFAQVRSELESKSAKGSTMFGPDSFGELRKAEQTLLAGGSLSSQQMLLMQLKATDAHMRVELLSKIAESAIATAKRLQNPQ